MSRSDAPPDPTGGTGTGTPAAAKAPHAKAPYAATSYAKASYARLASAKLAAGTVRVFLVAAALFWLLPALGLLLSSFLSPPTSTRAAGGRC